MMPSNRQLVLGTFQNLEQAFIGDMRSLRTASKLAPCVVLVPNHLLRVHLRRALAHAGCPHANFHFLTSRNLADRLAGNKLTHQGRTMVPPFILKLATLAALREHRDQIDYFAPVADRDGFHEAMLATLRDLKDAGVTPEALDRAARHLTMSGPKRFTRTKLTEIAKLWKFIERKISEHRFYDETDLLLAAANEAPNSPWLKDVAHMFIYGFYDATGAQRRLIEACFSVMPATVYFPFEDSTAFEYAKPTLNWFGSLGFEQHEAPATSEENSTLRTLQQRLFSGPTNVESLSADTDDEALLLVSAPGETREAEEIVREVASPPSGAAHTRYGVLMRSHTTYTEMLRYSLDATEIKGYFHASLPLSRTLCGKALLLLVDLMGTIYRRAPVMDLAAIARPEYSAQWNQFTIDAAIIEDRRAWIDRLRRLRSHIEKKLGRKDETARQRIASLDALCDFVNELFDALDRVSSQKHWRTLSAALEEALKRFAPAEPQMPQIIAQLGQIARLDIMEIPPSHEYVRSLLHETLDRPQQSEGRFEQDEPTVAALMEARGVPFDVVIIPGMVERAFPLPMAQDPILLDSEREEVARNLKQEGHPVLLPLKRHRRKEEELLFALAVGAARKRLVLTFPRIDSQSARPRVPSHFLLKVIEAVTGRQADFDELDRFIQSKSGRYVPLSRLEVSARDRAVTLLEYDLSSLAKALQEDVPDALLYLTRETPFFERALRAETARWNNPEFTAYDGVVCDVTLRKRLSRGLHDLTAAVSATHLEQYARCPFVYFLKHVLRVDPVEEPERIGVVSPLDRGSLVHEILWQFFSELAEAKDLPLTGENWPRMAKVAQERFDRFEKRGVSGYPLTWKIETDRILTDLAEFLKRESAEAVSFVPSYFEVRFGMQRRDSEESHISTEEPVPFAMGRKDAIGFCGKIDRIDVDPSSQDYRVMDYKTGRPPSQKDNSFRGGTALQLPVYLIAAEHLLKAGVADYAEYYHATTRGKWKHVKFTADNWPDTLTTLRRILKTIVAGIRAGRFYAYPEKEKCKRCDFRGACGQGRLIEHKWQSDARATRDFMKMTEIE